MVTHIIGGQWGDEGKGKIVDLLAQKMDCTVRFQGGNNAGHTVINEYGTFPLHLVPSGIFNNRAMALITNGVVLDLEVLKDEIDMLKKSLPNFDSRFVISPRAHVIMPYHKILDTLYEEAKGKAKVGTTGRGIGPSYSDKVSYNGIRLMDFSDKKSFRLKLETSLLVKNKIIKGLGGKPLNVNEVYDQEMAKFEKIKKYVKETFTILQSMLNKNKKVLMEGAQGMFLDNDWGTYPFVTGSNVVSGAVTAAAGIPPQSIKKVIGVVKAYTTRVGSGPFPTELLDKTGEKLRTTGHEFGTTTGRPRRCGWLDCELIRFTAQLNGITDIAVTKLDILDKFESIKICVGYKLNGKKINYVNCTTSDLDKITPIYKVMKGWNKSISTVKKFKDLPLYTKKYLKEIEKQTGVKISLVSVGPARDQTIRL